ncbi:hypothetical protein AAZX31_02G038700 [Glycine max]|uniref:Cyanobacterial aminoacyl-tRNA synthetase CAAD domain-containing protein n=2 Tax=Glycine subgen. Soja TaxID=1462606 RepID=C6SXE0_SOYBN|nr:Protein CURVATURE THYLAKOID 1D, chloroplastic-like [Glycine max]XP_028195805.1 protein CURVATURE THYLAKOID 1D, chloroplastic-like [Glycine soja]ACU13913.1 unknown [Glycine max]KAH1058634.1 hypothetical protein GYH30_002959 [Glycine max]KAH1260166.1 Protein CURVATURE THYLAKOID 1D, chloroplastic [Glycine max]KRH69655.1 hypothetical protein GLYMA_02G040600v4 [Glycine max]RZC23335.1 Protein CURVATURE THYLAKOID 1D, chloroplastic isoform A [Glycine soja]|eukprot:NP_001235620.1 uncharacterized protein LOC100305966 [Glycine max]
MGLCTVQPITLSKLPNASSFLPKPKPSLPQSYTPSAAHLSRSVCLRNLSPKATSSEEERSSGGSQFFNEKRDGVIILEDVKEDNNKNEFDKTVIEDTKQDLFDDDGQGLSFDLLDKLNFDTDDTGSIVVYGGGALVALWLTSAVIGAIDSIPLFPKLLEVVGLAYTVWFTSRYLLFKQNRDELGAKIEELKGQIFGSEDN